MTDTVTVTVMPSLTVYVTQTVRFRERKHDTYRIALFTGHIICAYVCSIGPISCILTGVLSPLCAISTFNCEQVKPLTFPLLPVKLSGQKWKHPVSEGVV